jgi:hypothetical protein
LSIVLSPEWNMKSTGVSSAILYGVNKWLNVCGWSSSSFCP